ncbi:MAG: FKBP-type peptidyl-prolyl cis-trans isomerase [Rikenellaceae bacterium]
MAKKSKRANPEYVAVNQVYLDEIREEDDTKLLSKGVMYKVLEEGEGESPESLSSLVTVHYRGTLIFGQEFDSTYGDYPESFRLRDVIEGWQIALKAMRVGDKWKIYVPSSMGYGDKEEYYIPGGSTLIFEVELLSVN